MPFLSKHHRPPSRPPGVLGCALFHAATRLSLVAVLGGTASAQEQSLAPGVSGGVAATAAVESAEPVRRLYIREYRVLGTQVFPKVQVEEAVYPFLGPGRTEDDVEQARAALEKAYHDQGYQAAAVQVPPQTGRGGIVLLQVSEGKVGRLRVKGARFFLPSHIKAKAQSMAEGKAVNFNNVARDIISLNQLGDRQVTPSLAAGAEPGTVDVELTVKDKFPLHGSVELNNRYSADTSPLRVSTSLSYANLWQAGHSIGASYQTSPQEPDAVKVFAGFYIWRFPRLDSFSLLLQGTKSDSKVSTIGNLAVAGRGETLGGRAIWTLLPGKDFYHSFNFGFDCKRTRQLTVTGDAASETLLEQEVTYYPVSAAYSATWAPKGSETELNLGATFGIRGTGGGRDDFEQFRFGADGNFLYLRGDLAHTHDLPGGFEAFAKVQGQVASGALLNTEQFPGGGLGTTRGYLEAEVLGDHAIFGTAELRSPSLLGWLPSTWKGNEWRIYLFGDGGALSLHDALPEQQRSFRLASFGVGSRIQFLEYLNGSVDLALPVLSQTTTRAGDPFVTFRVWADF